MLRKFTEQKMNKKKRKPEDKHAVAPTGMSNEKDSLLNVRCLSVWLSVYVWILFSFSLAYFWQKEKEITSYKGCMHRHGNTKYNREPTPPPPPVYEMDECDRKKRKWASTREAANKPKTELRYVHESGATNTLASEGNGDKSWTMKQPEPRRE